VKRIFSPVIHKSDVSDHWRRQLRGTGARAPRLATVIYQVIISYHISSYQVTSL